MPPVGCHAASEIVANLAVLFSVTRLAQLLLCDRLARVLAHEAGVVPQESPG
jgi:hypothetical protein